MNASTVAMGALCLFIVQASTEIRIDTFDKNSRRAGYLIIDPRTGRVDQFDRNSNRLGYGSITPEMPGRGPELYDRNGRPVSIDRKLR